MEREGEIWQLKGLVADYKERQTCLQAAAECAEAGKAWQAERPVQEKKGKQAHGNRSRKPEWHFLLRTGIQKLGWTHLEIKQG